MKLSTLQTTPHYLTRSIESSCDCLYDYLKDKAIELLEQNGIKQTDFKLLYSLSYCQWDGTCFNNLELSKDDIQKATGISLENFDTFSITIKQSWHYYHENSMSYHTSFDFKDDVSDDIRDAFSELRIENEVESIIVSICKELEKLWYEYIEEERKNDEAYYIIMWFFDTNNIEIDIFDIDTYDFETEPIEGYPVLAWETQYMKVYIPDVELTQHTRTITEVVDGFNVVSDETTVFYTL